jgi:hypothetical protein
MLRLLTSSERCVPQRLVAAAAGHLRDASDEVALTHLETIARSGFAWTQPLLLKVFGKVDNHRLTVLRIRAAAKLAQARCYGGVPALIKALKEQTSIQDDVNREWDASLQTAWWKEEAIDGIASAAGGDRFGHSPDASDADQVASVRRIEKWWNERRVELWSKAPPIDDPALVDRIRTLILAFEPQIGTSTIPASSSRAWDRASPPTFSKRCTAELHDPPSRPRRPSATS